MLEIKAIEKVYHTGSLDQVALNKVSIAFRDSEFVAILGPSGSGKTTLLNVIGGLDRYDDGDLVINGVSTKEYKDRDWDTYRNHTIGFVFQSYNLIAHQSILSNVELALTISGMSRDKRTEKAKAALERVGLGKHIHKKPSELSGGQMQRVAIARALVNDPDIVLADEPTGALDSETSVQIMDILKEIAQDRLVVMVTHNPELAHQYAERIVTIKDGEIISDTNPYQPPKHAQVADMPKKKASMSFLTALSLSFNNLWTKKARTFLVSFAGSIGIIGIALIMALSSGVNAYIEGLEEKTLAQYPMTISKTSMDLSAMMGNNIPQAKKGQAAESQTISSMLNGSSTNDLAHFRDYLESNPQNIKKAVNDIEYSYDLTPTVFRQKKGKIIQVQPNNALSQLGIGSSMSSMMGLGDTQIFHALPGNKAIYQDQYKIKEGQWPTNKNEVIVVLGRKNTISDLTLYGMGLRNPETLEAQIKAFQKGKTTKKSKPKTYELKSFLNRSFTFLPQAALYTYNSKQKTWNDHSTDQKLLAKQIKKGIHVKIVGVASPKDQTENGMLSSGISYLPVIDTTLREQAKTYDVVKAQLKHPKTNIFTNESFGKSNVKKAFDPSHMFTVDAKKVSSAFQVNKNAAGNLSNMKIDPRTLQSSINPQAFASLMPKLDVTSLLSSVKFNLPEKQTQQLLTTIVQGYGDYLTSHHILDEKKLQQTMTDFLTSDEFKKAMANSTTSNTKSLQETRNVLLKTMQDIAKGYLAYAQKQAHPENFEENFNHYMNSPEVNTLVTSSVNQLTPNASQNQLDDKTIQAVSQAFRHYLKKANLPTSKQLGEAFTAYVRTPKVSSAISKVAMSSINTKDLEKAMQKQMQASSAGMQKAMTTMMASLTKGIAAQIQKSMGALMSNPSSLMSFDPTAFAKAIKMNLSEQDLKALMNSLMNSSDTTYEDNLKSLGYASKDQLSTITVYPKDFSRKKKFEKVLASYNKEMKAQKLKKRVITYNDTMGLMLKNFTSMVNTISYVLVALVSISLVVSSIMIGVITYISVLERRKEIGILRAIGASKRNVAQVFNAETIITGALSGVIGIAIATALMPVMTKIVQTVSKRPDIVTTLPIPYAFGLIVISIVLTLIGGIIPSRRASRSDPVSALRSSD